MIEILKDIQLDLMLILSGISGATALFMALSKSLTKERKFYLILVELFTVILLLSDRAAYLYRGDESEYGYWIVRISNFMLYAMVLLIVWGFNRYLEIIVVKDIGLEKTPLRLRITDWAVMAGMALLIFSQFTGLYYTFDEFNRYQRSPGFIIGMIIPLGILFLELTLIIRLYRQLRTGLFISLVLFTTMPLIAAILQLKLYGLSIINITIGMLTSLLYLFALQDMNMIVNKARKIEIEYLKNESEGTRRLFTQTAEALASAIDAKDKYTKGHSSRVAEYSRKIAELAGKNPQECDEIYYAALLHDVGKIGISKTILNKNGKLTSEEYEEIKQHPVIGAQILSSISESPYLSIGAQSHHERYDGRGYPDGLKGNDIPEIARIIAVADAYDAMTSKRSYRDAVPQQVVREEFVKCLGTQFDPEFGKIMIHLIDVDEEYQMKEKEEVKELAGKNELVCKEYRSSVSEGIVLSPNITRIRLTSVPNNGYPADYCIPSIILFDSLDARIHKDKKNAERLLYLEYGEIKFNGEVVCKAARKIKPLITRNDEAFKGDRVIYDVEAVRVKDHALIKIISETEVIQVIVALPDSSRWAYIGLTGEHCYISNVSIKHDDITVPESYIPRIAEEISYIDVPEGDIPNVQVDGYRTSATDGIALKNKLTVDFHTMSLPTARLVWHCPFISIFYSQNGKINGPGYHEYALIRLDGENWDSADYASNKFTTDKIDDYYNWDDWKAKNKNGMECSLSFKRKGNVITFKTENAGINITNVTTINEEAGDVFVAISGDQCALTNIRIKEA